MCLNRTRVQTALFFILLVAQLVPGQTKFFKVQFCNRRAYLNAHMINYPKNLLVPMHQFLIQDIVGKMGA